MNAVIIPSSNPYSLTPLCDRKNIGSLPIVGKPLSAVTELYLTENNIDSIIDIKDLSADKSDDYLILIQENLITNLDIASALDAHIQSKADITAVLAEPSADNGIRRADLCVTADKDGRVTSYSSGVAAASPLSYPFSGIFIFAADSALLTSSDLKTHTANEIFSAAISRGMSINAFVSDSKFTFVNTQTDYILCHRAIMSGRIHSLSLGSDTAREIRPGFFANAAAEISGGVSIEPPVFISRGCKIQTGAKLGPNVFVGENCIIGTNAEISNSVIGRNCIIGEYSIMDGAVLCSDINLGANVRIYPNTIIGNACRIGSGAVIARDVRIWHNKRIEEKTRISSSLLHASLATESLFRNGRIDGEINADITPEFMAKLGAALGTMFPKSKIAICSASAPICGVLARAAESGISSSGSACMLFGEQPLPLFRCGIIYHKITCGIHISQSADREIFFPEITVISSDGADFDSAAEHTLEDIFFGGIFTRCSPDKVIDTADLGGFRTKYTQDILNSVKSTVFSKNMEIRTASESVSEILETVLSELEKITNLGSKKEFEVDITLNGQSFYLYSTDKVQIDKQTLFAVCTKLYLEYFGARRIVLPVSVSDKIRDYSGDTEIIECGISDYEFIKTMLSHGLDEQFRIFFDGIFFSVILLDYLNRKDISFGEFIGTIPSFKIFEEEVECPNIRKNEIIRKLYEKYGGENPSRTDGIKIYQSNGWVLIIPEKYRHCIKVITEGYTAEAANEISAIFTNQIKRLAKPN